MNKIIKQNYSNLKRKTSGITLIALIITIIVLLILAGVTIVAITSNESVPNKAVEARKENQIGAAKDAATLLVEEKIQEYYENKYVNRLSNADTVLTYLQDEAILGGDNGITTGEYNVSITENEENEETGIITVKRGSEPIATGTVEVSGKIIWDKEIGIRAFNINVDGEIIDLNTLNKTTVAEHYGKTVITINNVPYGLFYVDYDGKYSNGEKKTVYLRAKSVVGKISFVYQTTSSESLNILKQLSPIWKTKFIDNDNGYAQVKAAQNLCNPKVNTWSSIGTEFKKKYGENNVNYVIGAPTIELFLESYNDKYKTSYSVDFFEPAPKTYDAPGYKYSINGASYNTNAGNIIKAGDGMYRKVSNDVVWLASPLYNGGLCDISYNSRIFSWTL